MTDALTLPNVAFIGKAGAGKTTAAEILRDVAAYECRSIAGPLKDIAALIWGDEARKDRAKLQGLGVAVRDIDTDAWVNLLVQRVRSIENDRPAARVCVDDVRFPNEVRALELAGFLFVRVHAPRNVRVSRLRANGKLQDESQLEHVSEHAIDGFEPNEDVWNIRDRDALADQLVDLLNRYRR